MHQESTMNAVQTLLDASDAPHTAFVTPLEAGDIRNRTPAALAETADPRTSAHYVFLSSERVIRALGNAGFVPVSAAQTRSRSLNTLSARHVIRFRRRYETVQLRDCIPEILFLNSHDARTSTQFRLALYRPICCNGLIVCDETLPAWRVSHRGDVLDEVIAAALRQSEHFVTVAASVERMERTVLEEPQRLAFAQAALGLRFPKRTADDLRPEQVLVPRREADVGPSLWKTYNVVQEAVIKGGLSYRTATHRAMQSRGIRAIRQDVHLNTELWKMAVALAA
jgi:hypothetical protein